MAIRISGEISRKKFIAIYNSAIIWNTINFCLNVASCKDDYNAKVMFRLFASPSGRSQKISHGRHYKKITVLCMLVVEFLDGDLAEKI